MKAWCSRQLADDRMRRHPPRMLLLLLLRSFVTH
jgi:hypothetical protein